MPTQEERLSTLEETVTVLGKGIDDLNHNVTILLGVTSEHGKDIRGIKVNLTALTERVGAFEQNVNSRFEALDGRFEALDGRFEALDGRFGALDGRFGALDGHFEMLERNVNSRFGALEQSVNSRFGALEQSVNSRFEEQGKKLDQVLLLLNSVIPRSEQGA
jgi:uncharacterized coiled-coil protein SlyX